jgi:blue copper oxidase
MLTVCRRDVLKALAALGLAAVPRRAWPDHAGTTTPGAAADLCGSGNRAARLFVPGTSGLFGRLAASGVPLTLSARPAPRDATGPWPLQFSAEHRGVRFVNPTLLLHPGERVRIELHNALPESTIVHWHGFTIDTRNDGAGMPFVAAGDRYAYDFEVRNRGSLYWYHPHPHGSTASQAYRGLFGLIEVEDRDERALRTALELAPGRTEIPLILQDRRTASGGRDYVASAGDRMHGFLGDTVLINGTECPYLEVATRIYRFRVLNASNARTYRLGFRTGAGASAPFLVIGNDGGLLPTPRRCEEAFLATAERLDILLDLSGAPVGETLRLETRGFDPMHMEMPAMAPEADPGTDRSSTDYSKMGGSMAPQSTAPSGVDHAAMGHGGSFPEGAARSLLELRVREKIQYAASVPDRLCSLASIDIAQASERPLRLGFAKGQWRINDRVFAMGETPIEVRRNTVETWLIRNYFNSMPHAMHLHGFAFEVLERQTSPDQIAALRVDEHGRLATDLGRKDTVLVWPGESVRIGIDFSCPFTGEQTYVFHCHNLEHEDAGMMLGVKLT